MQLQCGRAAWSGQQRAAKLSSIQGATQPLHASGRSRRHRRGAVAAVKRLDVQAVSGGGVGEA